MQLSQQQFEISSESPEILRRATSIKWSATLSYFTLNGVRSCTCSVFFYQPTRVLLSKTPTRLREHNCLAKDGPLHSYGGCDGVVVSFLYSGVICVGVSVVYTRGCIGFCNVCLFSLRSVDYVMECAGYCRMYLFAHSRATHGVILVGCRRVC